MVCPVLITTLGEVTRARDREGEREQQQQRMFTFSHFSTVDIFGWAAKCVLDSEANAPLLLQQQD